MRTSQAGIDLIKKYEGLRLTAYYCPAGKLTIGYGHTSAAGNPIVSKGMAITEEEAEQILRNDLVSIESEVERLVKYPVLQNQFDALVSFQYNTGALGRSTLLKRINDGRFADVPAEFMKWINADGRPLPGLIRRRREEAKMWRGIDTNEPVNTNESRFTPDMPKASKSMMSSKEGNAAAIAGSASVLGVANEVTSGVQDATDIVTSLTTALGRPTVMVLLVVVIAAIAIWYFRKRRLDEEGA